MATPLRLLIIEDSEDDTLLLLRALRQGGYEPTHKRVEDARSMRESLQNGEWDVIVSDYALPRFDGLAALEVLRLSGLDIPFIIVSGIIGEETAVEAMRAGAHDYVMKGNLKRLIPAIDRELREAAERRSRKIAEEEIRILSSALAQSASLVIITNLLGVIEYVNPTFVRVTGYQAADVVGQNWDVLSPNLTSSDQLDALVQAVRARIEWRGEIQTVAKAGAAFWVSVTLSPVRDSNGIITRLMLVAEDITERKKLEAELWRYNEQLEQMVQERTAQLRQAKEETEVILNTTSDAIALASSNGDILKTNPAFGHIFGNSINQTIERLLWVLADDECIELVSKALLSVIHNRREERVEANLYTDDGRKIDADLVFVPVPQTDEEKSGLVLSLRDITQFKEVERFKARFVANAAHDLSNPLTAIKLRLHLLRRSPERLNEHIQILEQQIGKLENLVSELRTLSELDQGKVTLDIAELDMNALITEVVDAHRPIAEAKQQQLIFEPDVNLLQMMADYRKHERVVVNLVANALNYTPAGGRICVTSCCSSDSITFSVEDTGMGIAEEDLPHIFERFYRSDRAKTSNKAGTGLGLAITKEMVELHRGKITVISQVDVGTRFIVQLPRP
jgi:PAS domain S-box-containing protein